MKTKYFFKFLVIMVLVLMTVSPVSVKAQSPQVLYVVQGGSTSGSCDSWASACELQYALANTVSDQEIWVAAGVYKPTTGTDRAATFQLKNGVAIYGGFAGTETERNQRDLAANLTILSGDLNGDDNGGLVKYDMPNRLDNSYHVVTGATDSTLDGFTISDGNGSNGGGLYNESGNPTLINIIFSKNSAGGSGGGMYNLSSNSPTLTNVTFSNNSAWYGGGLYNAGSSPTLTHVTFIHNAAFDGAGGIFNAGSPTLTDVTFIGNAAVVGGGMNNYAGSPTLTNVTFSGNSAGYGGGMSNSPYSHPTLMDVTFSKNSAVQIGGGMFNNVSDIVLARVTFTDNVAYYGGGMANNQSINAILTNVTFSGNSANYGGGMINLGVDKPIMTNVTFSSNSAENYGGGICNWGGSNPQIRNSLFWGNTASDGGAQIYDKIDEYSSSIVNDSVVDGGCPVGSSCANIITADPLLGALGDNGGLTQTISLLPDSSAIDTGNDATCATTDQRGVSRPQGLHCDIGAYEYEKPLNNPPVITNIAAPTTPVQLGQSINATVTFNDSDVGDAHTVTWDWGDGSTTIAPAAVSSGSGSHIYTSAGVYTITATITDKAGASASATFQYVVVYDSSAGFVTGGGWINSPLRAYTPDPSLTGKATFGFVSKYQKGANVPTGDTEFQFNVANFNFESTSYDWLTIGGTKAQFKGTGTINGEGEYKFILTAIDSSPDMFRIKIWDKETGETIYDNQLGASDNSSDATELGGGSIIIHKAK